MVRCAKRGQRWPRFTVGLVLASGVRSPLTIALRWRQGVVARYGEGVCKGFAFALPRAGFVLIPVDFAPVAAASGMVHATPLGRRHATVAPMRPALVPAIGSALRPGSIRRAVRHMLLIGMALWAAAHLLVNGETAVVVPFGAFIAWSRFDLVRWRGVRTGGASSPVSFPVAIVAGVALVWRLHEWALGVLPMA